MMKHLSLLILILMVSSCNSERNKNVSAQSDEKKSIVNVPNGSINSIVNFKSKFVKDRNVDIWLPENYDPKDEHAVIYMHDGQMLFDSTNTWNKQEWKVDEAAQKLIDDNKIPPTIVVGIWNISEIRHSDYFPKKAFDLIDMKKQKEILKIALADNGSIATHGFNADNYLKFIVEELKPYIDSTYSVSKNPTKTIIAGSSMGGLISMYAICEYPAVFGGAACISTHWPGVMPNGDETVSTAIFNYLSDNIPDPTNHKLYFDYGDKTLDSFYLKYGKPMDKTLSDNGYSKSNSQNILYPGQDHSELSWQKRIHIPFEFLLKK